MANKLTPKQQLFVKNYIANGFNASKAAIDAGYSRKTAVKIGSENLQKPDVKRAIEEEKAKIANKIDITAEWKMSILKDIVVAEYDKPSDRLKAVEILNKMQGHDEPQKVDVTSNGQSLSAVVYLPDNES